MIWKTFKYEFVVSVNSYLVNSLVKCLVFLVKYFVSDGMFVVGLDWWKYDEQYGKRLEYIVSNRSRKKPRICSYIKSTEIPLGIKVASASVSEWILVAFAKTCRKNYENSKSFDELVVFKLKAFYCYRFFRILFVYINANFHNI